MILSKKIVGTTAILLDSSDSYYSNNTWLYAKQILKLLKVRGKNKPKHIIKSMTNQPPAYDKFCKSHFPENILYYGVQYRLHTQRLGNGYEVMYIEFDGEYYKWNNQLLRNAYKLCKELPVKKEYDPIGLNDNINYVLSFEEIVAHFKLLMAAIEFEPLDEIVTKETKFRRELATLLNRYSKENGSDTPDFILANYLIGCLDVFNNTQTQR
jgi:hypothetical protein